MRVFDCNHYDYYARCHESVDRGLLKNLLRMLVDLQLYHDVFEIEFLQETETMYHAEALKILRDPEFTVRFWGGGVLKVYGRKIHFLFSFT